MSKAIVKHTSPTLEQRAENINRYQGCVKASALQMAGFAILTGMELNEASKDLAKHGGDRRSSGHSVHLKLEDWLKANCPGMSEKTAKRYMALASGCKGKALKNGDDEILSLLECAPSQLPENKRAILEKESTKLTDGKTISEMYLDFGIVKKPRKSTGGDTTPRCQECKKKIEINQVDCPHCGKLTGQEEEQEDSPEEAAINLWTPLLRDIFRELDEDSHLELPKKGDVSLAKLEELQGVIGDKLAALKKGAK